MKKEYIKYVDKPTWCNGKTGFEKNCIEYEEFLLKDMDEKENLFSNYNTRAFINVNEMKESLTNSIINSFNTKCIATLYFINENRKYVVLKGVELKLENRIKGDYIVTDATILKGPSISPEICRVKMCEDEKEAIEKLIKGDFEQLKNYNNLKFHLADNIEEISRSTLLNMYSISNRDNILNNHFVEEMIVNGEISKEEERFINNLICFEEEIWNTHDFIRSTNGMENHISIKEIGERYSARLANIMFENGFSNWYFKDYQDFQKMKEQLKETIRSEYQGESKERIVEDIEKSEKIQLSENATKMIQDLDFPCLKEKEMCNDLKTKIIAYTDTVEGRIEEDFHNKEINESEYNYLKDNTYIISMKCIRELKDSMNLEEELNILDSNIKEILKQMPENYKEYNAEEEEVI